MKPTLLEPPFKTVHELHAIRWHLENNVMPILNEDAVNGILNTLRQLNGGTLTVNDQISKGANCTIAEMCQDLRIDLTEAI